jgi:ribosomal protein L11 methyltransferase
MVWTSLILTPGTDPDVAWVLLENSGYQPIFSSEDPDGSLHIVVDCPRESLTTLPPCVHEAHPYQPPSDIDWEAQWQSHGYNYHDGYVHYDVAGRTLKLTPGAGFGDLSHPTTHLALQLLTPLVSGKIVLDIGCGSGVLTLASAALGAAHTYGVDIDPAALIHAQANAQLNQLEEHITFADTTDAAIDVIVINMIWSEQRIAWQSWEQAARQAKHIVVSGLLKDESDRYIAEMTQKFPWKLAKQIHDGEWIGLLISGHGHNGPGGHSGHCGQ